MSHIYGKEVNVLTPIALRVTTEASTVPVATCPLILSVGMSSGLKFMPPSLVVVIDLENSPLRAVFLQVIHPRDLPLSFPPLHGDHPHKCTEEEVPLPSDTLPPDRLPGNLIRPRIRRYKYNDAWVIIKFAIINSQITV